jgi:enamine deaminase RidA (YjgF/YER057c/UK114 family)
MPWEKEYGYVQAAKVGDTIYVSGQVSHDDTGNIVGRGDMETQMRQAYSNIPKILALTIQFAFDSQLLLGGNITCDAKKWLNRGDRRQVIGLYNLFFSDGIKSPLQEIALIYCVLIIYGN